MSGSICYYGFLLLFYYINCNLIRNQIQFRIGYSFLLLNFRTGIGFNDQTRKRNWNWNPIRDLGPPQFNIEWSLIVFGGVFFLNKTQARVYHCLILYIKDCNQFFTHKASFNQALLACLVIF